MAKSLRSKWRQRMRSEKRKKTQHKELERLKRVVDIERTSRRENTTPNGAAIVSPSATSQSNNADEPIPMAVDGTAPSKVYNKRTMLDQDGHYPDWMGSRRIKKLKSKKKRLRKQK